MLHFTVAFRIPFVVYIFIMDNGVSPLRILLQGFDHHVRNEHNMWAYVFFLIHLEDVKTSDFTALELYVHKLVSPTFRYFYHKNLLLGAI